jgi:hypothetical protein
MDVMNDGRIDRSCSSHDSGSRVTEAAKANAQAGIVVLVRMMVSWVTRDHEINIALLSKIKQLISA